MAPNFQHLLRKPAGKAKKPPALPAGHYPGVIKSWETGDANANKTPYVRFQCIAREWPEDVAEADRADEDGNAIDLAKRQMRKDYYLSDEALYRLDEMLRSIGVDPEGKLYEEVLPDTIGTEVILVVTQYMSKTTSEIGSSIEQILPAA